MKFRILTGIVSISFLILLSSSCKDESIYFTENEVIGDFIAEKEITLESKMIMLPYNSYKSINILGNKGECTAITSNDEVVKAEVYNGYRKSVSINVLKPKATATITVQDEGGQSATIEIVTVDSELILHKMQLSNIKCYLGGKWELMTVSDGKTGKTTPVEGIFWEFKPDGCYLITNPATGETINSCEEWVKKTTSLGYDAPFIGNLNIWIERIHNDVLLIHENSENGFSYGLVRREYYINE